MSDETQWKVLELFYEQWFKNYPVGFQVRSLMVKLNSEGNEIPQAVELLENNNLIQRDQYGLYVISTYGIDVYEQNLSPSLLSRKKNEKKMILEALLDLYNEDIYQRMSSEDLTAKIQFSDYNYLLGIIVYLENKGLVDIEMFIGGKFFIRLSAYGFQSMQDKLTNNSQVMTNAYRILFVLENSLRQFIESKLKNKFGADWWENGVSLGVRKKVEQMKKDEFSLGWSVNVTNDYVDYGLFSDAGWGAFAYNAGQEIISKYGYEVTFLDNVSVSNIVTTLKDYADGNYDIIIAQGYEWGRSRCSDRKEISQLKIYCIHWISKI